MAHIVVLGAGIGGMPAAYELREVLDKEHDITVVNSTDFFQFTPSNPWLAVGWRTREAITLPLEPLLKKHGINFTAGWVEKIDAAANKLVLKNGQEVAYDYLLIATGPRLAFEEVPGSGPVDGFTQSVCTVDHAEKSYIDFQKLLADPGPVVVGAVQFASCFGPAYEYAAILDTALCKHNIRNKVPMTFVTSEPYVGHLGLGGVGDSRGLLEHELRQRHIKWITNAKITKVEAGKVFADEVNEKGEVVKQHELPFKHAMLLPGFKGVDPVAAVEGLCNPRGFVIVDEHQRSPKYPNIYSAGVCIAIPPVEATPVPTGAPKTGYMIESMVTATAHNIRAELDGRQPAEKATWNAVCLADFGDTGVAFVALPQIPPRNVNWSAKGGWVHMAKAGFESYFIGKIKKGESEPFYEKLVMDTLGIHKLKG